jgi:small-conductance mechanosensitive channel
MKLTMYIVAIAWIYVVLLMSLTEHSVIAGLMTFLFYCVIPLAIILYLIATPRRKRARQAAENIEKPAEDSLDQIEKKPVYTNDTTKPD